MTQGSRSKEKDTVLPQPENLQVLQNLAVSQMLLVAVTLTTAHVQIITRISSAYPVWVWYVAVLCHDGKLLGRTFVGFMVMYATVQAGLFASFLPPA
jgi:phosphatidylinositol glycan class V